MKNYCIKTQSDNNPSLLHSLMVEEYTTHDPAEAATVFANEVAALAAQYATAAHFPFPPNAAETANALYCTLYALDPRDPDQVEVLESSGLYYTR